LSGDPALKAEAIHHVDSAFGVLLVVIVFLSNILINYLQEYLGEESVVITVVIVFFVASSILTGLTAILRQSFFWRLAAWFSFFMLLLNSAISLCVLLLWRVANVIAAIWQVIPLLYGAGIISTALTFYVVIDAYSHRLSSVSCQDDQLTHLQSLGKYLIRYEILALLIGLPLMFVLYWIMI